MRWFGTNFGRALRPRNDDQAFGCQWWPDPPDGRRHHLMDGLVVHHLSTTLRQRGDRILEPIISYTVLLDLLLIPSAAILWRHPTWKTVSGIGTAFTILLCGVMMLRINASLDWRPLALGVLVGWSMLLTVAYFANKHRRSVRTLEMLAVTDELTGLYNRRFFESRLEQAWSFRHQAAQSMTMVMIDVDHFKRVNDSKGHLCGDEALKHLARVLIDNVRESDTLVRMGGEEFAVLLPDTPMADGTIIAERIRQAVQDTDFIYEAERMPLTISVGISSWGGQAMDEFIRRADKALYHAKVSGRNRVFALE